MFLFFIITGGREVAARPDRANGACTAQQPTRDAGVLKQRSNDAVLFRVKVGHGVDGELRQPRGSRENVLHANDVEILVLALNLQMTSKYITKGLVPKMLN